MSEECHEITRRGGGTSPASLPDDDNLLREILLRLPSQPSSLPRASAVCRRWRRLVTDPQFLRRFRVHHRKPPILGFFEGRHCPVFRSILDPPVRIPPEHLPLQPKSMSILLGCRHGRVLVHDVSSNEVIVGDPITGERSRVALPPDFNTYTLNGAVLCAADDKGHVHGSCHSSPFKVVLVSMNRNDLRLIACVYSSKTGAWGNFISIAVPFFSFATDAFCPATVSGKALYWLLMSADMLEFDLDRQSLTVIRGAPVTDDYGSRQVIQADDDSGVGQAILSYPSFQMWQRKVGCHGVATWVLQKTFEMHSLVGFPPKVVGRRYVIVGYAEDAGVIFLYVAGSVYMLHLESMQARRLHEASHAVCCFPLTSFHTAGDCSSLVSHWW